MKKFRVTQSFDAPTHAVAEAFRSETTWQGFSGLPFVGTPSVQSFVDAEPVEIDMAYKVSIDLPALAEKFIDPDKMTFVERTHLASDGTGKFTIIPDHYTKLLKAAGRVEIVTIDDRACERHIHGSVDVSLGWSGMLFESPVEDAIVNGLSQALRAQAAQISW